MQDNKKCIADLHNLPKETFRKIMREVSKAKAVDYNARMGAVCPVCGAERCRVTRSIPWYGNSRERYHRCVECGHCFKSVEAA
ncbi:hypothetical protein [Halodesulfovibrio aestuarii]|uniref:IS1595 family transposase n=1 Tax=Halodesulfovibrio aestuarii TaxID=126333 RepID=A0ABV4JUF3_9BACT